MKSDFIHLQYENSQVTKVEHSHHLYTYQLSELTSVIPLSSQHSNHKRSFCSGLGNYFRFKVVTTEVNVAHDREFVIYQKFKTKIGSSLFIWHHFLSSTVTIKIG